MQQATQPTAARATGAGGAAAAAAAALAAQRPTQLEMFCPNVSDVEQKTVWRKRQSESLPVSSMDVEVLWGFV